MRVGVPGEFHEDRWQRTAEDSEWRVIPRTLEAGGPSDTSYRVAKRSSDRSSARRPCLQVFQRHPVVAKGSSIGSSAQPLRPQVPQGHPRVAKGGFWPLFGTSTLPTGVSGASSRGEGGLLAGLWHDDLAHRHLRAIPACQRGFKAEKSSDLRAGRRSDLKAWRRRGAPRRR